MNIMCIFITLVAKAADKKTVSNILLNAGRRAEVIDNPSLRKLIAEDEIQFITTNGHCDCGTVLGDNPEEHDLALAKDIKKLKLKNWSQAKIDKFIDDQKKKTRKMTAKKEAEGGDNVEMWSNVISAILQFGGTQVGIFFRMYSGRVEDEIFEPRKKKLSFREFANTDFSMLTENEITYFW